MSVLVAITLTPYEFSTWDTGGLNVRFDKSSIELIENNDSKSAEEQINKVCSKMACHGSIRAGREMQIDEMNDLLRKMESTPFSGQCNHGRPTYVELKLNDIERLFGIK